MKLSSSCIVCTRNLFPTSSNENNRTLRTLQKVSKSVKKQISFISGNCFCHPLLQIWKIYQNPSRWCNQLQKYKTRICANIFEKGISDTSILSNKRYEYGIAEDNYCSLFNHSGFKFILLIFTHFHSEGNQSGMGRTVKSVFKSKTLYLLCQNHILTQFSIRYDHV